MTKGILYIAFGDSYLKLVNETIQHSCKFTNLPVCVITNIKETKLSNVQYIYLNKHQNDNRDIKTQMVHYTPFDETIYMDTDSIIRHSGIENHFNDELTLNLFEFWDSTAKIPRLYKTALNKTGCSLPLNVYNGAIIGFKKTDSVKQFFDTWNSFWELLGSGREMPALCCAIQKTKIAVTTLPKGVFNPDSYDESCTVQHNYNSNKGYNFFKEFKLSRLKENKPFDTNPSDWEFV